MSSTTNNPTVVQLNRMSEWANRFRAYRVMLNNQEVAKIRNGQEIQFTVPAGKHQLALTIDWCRSNSLDIDAQGGTVVLDCGSRFTGWQLLKNVDKALSQKDDYLWLRVRQQS